MKKRLKILPFRLLFALSPRAAPGPSRVAAASAPRHTRESCIIPASMYVPCSLATALLDH